MFRNFFGNDKAEEALDAEISRLLIKMEDQDPTAREYQTNLDSLERLTRLKEAQTKSGVSKETILVVAGNLLGLVMIMVYEQKHVMTTKGFTQLIKPR